MSLAFARAARCEFSNFGNLHSDGKTLPRLPSLTLDNDVFCRLPTSTMKPGISVSQAKYWPEDAGWRP
jgi:hypothetical protein